MASKRAKEKLVKVLDFFGILECVSLLPNDSRLGKFVIVNPMMLAADQRKRDFMVWYCVADDRKAGLLKLVSLVDASLWSNVNRENVTTEYDGEYLRSFLFPAAFKSLANDLYLAGR